MFSGFRRCFYALRRVARKKPLPTQWKVQANGDFPTKTCGNLGGQCF